MIVFCEHVYVCMYVCILCGEKLRNEAVCTQVWLLGRVIPMKCGISQKTPSNILVNDFIRI